MGRRDRAVCGGRRNGGSALDRQQLHRIQFIARRIADGGFPNARTLAAEFEVHERTIHRDLEYLRDVLRAPLAYDRARRGYVFRAPFELPPVRLSQEEFVALAAAAHLLALLAGTPFARHVQGALDKLRATLPDYVTVEPGGADLPVSFGVEQLRGDAERVAGAFELLQRAIAATATVELTYYTASRDETARRRLDPYHLHYAAGAWYAIAWCHRRRDMRMFALDRMSDLTQTEDRFTRDPAFDPRRYLERALRLEAGEPVPVAIRFDAQQARYIRSRRWHPSQSVEELPGGGLILRLQVGGLGEVQRWVLQYGPHAEVLEPEALRNAVVEACRGQLDTYLVRDRELVRR